MVSQCPFCGEEIGDDVYCSNCGKKIKENTFIYKNKKKIIILILVIVLIAIVATAFLNYKPTYHYTTEYVTFDSHDANITLKNVDSDPSNGFYKYRGNDVGVKILDTNKGSAAYVAGYKLGKTSLQSNPSEVVDGFVVYKLSDEGKDRYAIFLERGPLIIDIFAYSTEEVVFVAHSIETK